MSAAAAAAAAAATVPTYKQVQDKFAKILKIEPMDADFIINAINPTKFNTITEEDFINIIIKLTPSYIDGNSIKEKRKQKFLSGNISINTIKNHNIGHGASGIVKRTAKSKVFKTIILTGHITLYRILNEVLIAVILSCDPIYGKHVTTPTDVYYNRENNIIYIFMTPLNITLYTHLINIKDVLDTEEYFNIMKPIANILEYFNKNYKYYHNDLHCSNIMYNNSKKDYLNNPYLIDFGESCIEFNGTTYNICKSNDILTMHMSFLSIIKNKQVRKSISEIIHKLLTIIINDTDIPDSFPINLFEIFEFLGEGEAFYATSLDNIIQNNDIYKSILNTPEIQERAYRRTLLPNLITLINASYFKSSEEFKDFLNNYEIREPVQMTLQLGNINND